MTGIVICIDIRRVGKIVFTLVHTDLNPTTACSPHIPKISVSSGQSLSLSHFTLTSSNTKEDILK